MDSRIFTKNTWIFSAIMNNKEFSKMKFTPYPSAQNQKQKTYLSFRIKANLKKKKNFTSHNKAYPVQKFCVIIYSRYAKFLLPNFSFATLHKNFG